MQARFKDFSMFQLTSKSPRTALNTGETNVGVV